MLKDNNNIDNIFTSSLSDYGEDMPDYTWDVLEASLKKEKKKKRAIFYMSFAASVAIIIAFISGYLLNNFTNNSNQEIQKLANSNNKTLIIRPTIATIKNKEIYENNVIKTNFIANENEIDKKKNIKNKSTLENHFENKIADYAKGDNVNKDSIIITNEIIDKNENIAGIKAGTLSIDSVINKMLITNKILEITNDDILPEDKIIEDNIEEQLAMNKPSKWAVGGGFTPVYSNTSYTAQQPDLIDPLYGPLYATNEEAYIGEINNKEFSVSAGINAQYRLSKRFSLQSGINYASFDKFKRFTEIPLLLNINLINKRIGVYSKTGFGYGQLSNPHRRNLSAYNASIGVEGRYFLTKNFALSISPTYKYYLPIFNNIYKINHFGVFTGLSYSFE